MSRKETADAQIWSRKSILETENSILQQIMGARTAAASESAVAFARFLRLSGLDAENYPLFLKMLEIENHWVLDALIGEKDPFLMLSTIPPNNYVVAKAFD